MRLQRVPGCHSRNFGCLRRRPAVQCNACDRERGCFGNPPVPRAALAPGASSSAKVRKKQDPTHFSAPGHETGQNFALRYFRSTEYRPGPVSASNSSPPMMLTFL